MTIATEKHAGSTLFTGAVIIGLLMFTSLLFTWWYQPLDNKESVKTVGVLLAGDMKQDKFIGLKEGLEEQGYLEGVNVKYSVKNAQDNINALNELAGELVDENPAVLIALGGVEADALKEIIAGRRLEIPIVFAGVASALQRGLVDTYQNHETSITGVDNYHTQLAGKRLELLVKLLPEIERVLVVYDPKVAPGVQSLAIIEETAAALALQLVNFPVKDKEVVLDDLARILTAQDMDAVLLSSSYFLEAAAGDLIALALMYQVPVMAVNQHEVNNGAFAAYGVSFYQQGRQTAPLVTKILSGQHPSQIPIESPDKIELIVNLAVARKIGLELSPVGLSYATVINELGSPTGRGTTHE